MTTSFLVLAFILVGAVVWWIVDIIKAGLKARRETVKKLSGAKSAS